MTDRRAVHLLVALASTSWPTAGCSFSDPDPLVAQAKYEPYEESAFFADRRSMRTPPAHTVPREGWVADPLLRTGRHPHGVFVSTLPFRATPALLARGQERFDIFCATCHGALGDGDSLVARNMPVRPPPSLIEHQPHADEPQTQVPIGAAPDGGVAYAEAVDQAVRATGLHPHFWPGHVFEVISRGYGLMPSYARQLTVADRWAVIAWLEALRLSQRAQVAGLPPDVRAQLEEATP